MITNKHYKIITVSYEDSGYLYFENISDQVGWLYPRVHRGIDSSIAPNCEYSLNGVDWTSIDFNTWPYHVGPNEDGGAATGNLPGISVAPGARVYLRGTNTNWNPADWGGAGFRMSVPHIMGGNLLSLIDYNNMDTITTVPKFGEGAYYGPFAGDNNLISAEKMHFGNATTLANTALMAMFQNCKNLVKGPDLSKITTVGNDACRQMFEGCTSLTTASDLSSVTTVGSKGMQSMFNGCTSLNSNIDLSSVTTVGNDGMYTMFKSCTSLNSNIDLSSVTTVGRQGLFGMFENCSALDKIIDLSSITSMGELSLRTMFKNCSSLTSGPVLPSVLNNSCYSYMFENCTSITTAPALPATTLSDACYDSMFRGCSSLVNAPILPATTLVFYCYASMFSGCNSLNKVVSYAQDISADRCLTGWLSGVSSTGDFYNLGGVTYPSGASGIPTNWTEHTSL